MEHNTQQSPLVSLVCDTYNQAAYIGQVLEGFLMQKTTFPVEILVHDDASTDGTREIVERYAAEHPDKIRTILRRENMFSRDQKILEHYVFPHCCGKYIAICEGDDYWTDPEKLQRQIAYMEAHPECTLCFHAAELVDADGRHIGVQSPYDHDCIVPTSDVIRGMGGFCPTVSLVVPAELAKNRPAFCDLTSVDDAPLQIYFASRGTTYYFAKPMAAYRVNAAGSWTLAQRELKREKRIALQQSLIAMHTAFDEDTKGRFHEDVAYALTVDNFEILWLKDDLKTMKQPQFRAFYKKLPFRSRVRLHVQTYAPWLYGLRKGR